MQPIFENASLKPYNVFGIDVIARWLSAFASQPELEEVVSARPNTTPLILGGGSNTLFTRDYNGLVLRNEIKGIELLREDEQFRYVRVGAGENWHNFVNYTLEQDWGGLENLSFIPGSVGAAAIHNIDAFGVELKEIFYELSAYHLEERKIYTFSPDECAFAYRDSIFKQRHKGKFVILHVTFRLSKSASLKIDGAIRKELQKYKGRPSSMLLLISKAVRSIRHSIWPNTGPLANAGPFFKNPVISESLFDVLKDAFPTIEGHPARGGIQLNAGWLIEQCGWKGFRKGDAGCYNGQVLVNYGHASGQEMYALSEEIRQSIQSKLAVELEREVNIY
jgi:UDP-N-acetylmuramate dehydrogenase